MHIFSIQKLFAIFPYIHFAWKLYFCMGFAPLFFTEAFCTFIFQGRLHFTWFFMGIRHIGATRTSAKVGRPEAVRMIKQPKKTALVKENSEAAVGSNPIAVFFVRKAPKSRVGRTKTKKGRGVV